MCHHLWFCCSRSHLAEYVNQMKNNLCSALLNTDSDSLWTSFFFRFILIPICAPSLSGTAVERLRVRRVFIKQHPCWHQLGDNGRDGWRKGAWQVAVGRNIILCAESLCGCVERGRLTWSGYVSNCDNGAFRGLSGICFLHWQSISLVLLSNKVILLDDKEGIQTYTAQTASISIWL